MIAERTAEVDGVETRWLEAEGSAGPLLYVHGVPDSADLWRPFLEQTGGLAPDLPGFGGSAKPADFPYSIGGLGRWLERFAAHSGLDRFSLVAHDWGAAALAFAQAEPGRIERLVLIDPVPLLPGYRWHSAARMWRRPILGELAMGFALKRVLRRALPEPTLEQAWRHFDHGTQRAILKLYRSSDESVLERAGAGLASITCPALVVCGVRDPYIHPDFAHAYAAALGGPAEVDVLPDAGHWPWTDEPGSVQRIAAFLADG